MNSIQGDKACIYMDTPANVCKKFKMLYNDGSSKEVNENTFEHRMLNEFIEFIEMVQNKDYDRCYEMLEHSLIVCEAAETARRKGGVVFPEDKEC